LAPRSLGALATEEQLQTMRLGVTLPTFNVSPQAALDSAARAESLGIHGVFTFDHLWPMGDPTRPSLSAYPLAAAVAARTRHLQIGTLVARIGLLPDEVVLASLLGLSKIAGRRLIAGIGTGDKASLGEHERLGIPYLSATDRRRSLTTVARTLAEEGVEHWIGGGAIATNEVARTTGATLNLWGVSADQVAEEISRGTRVSWAGPLPKQAGAGSELLRALADAGASWAVWGWPRSLETVAEVAEAAGIELGFGALGDGGGLPTPE